jgi:putative oxidoreductase
VIRRRRELCYDAVNRAEKGRVRGHQGNAMTGGDDAIDPSRLILPGLGGFYRRLAPLSYALMRFSAGAVLFPHGVQKVFFTPIQRYVDAIAGHGLPLPTVLAYCTYSAELVGSACLALGLFTRVAAVVLWIEMSVIITIFQWQFGYFWTNRGIEYALLWWLLCIAIMFRGGGRYSLDRLIGKEF